MGEISPMTSLSQKPLSTRVFAIERFSRVLFYSRNDVIGYASGVVIIKVV
jgi:hypothetical protein